MVTHHFHTRMAPATVVCSCISYTLTFDTHLIRFHEKSVSGELIMALWISRAREDGHVVVENSVRHHVVGDEEYEEQRRVRLIGDMSVKINTEEQP